MGSLPNLHELERIEKKKEKRRERKLREELAKNIRPEQRKHFQLKKVPIAFYSPISTRSHRISPLTPRQLQAALSLVRRKESVNSSIDATSLRRLINLTNCRKMPGHRVSVQVRQRISRAFTSLTVAHGLMCAILIPLFGLQASNTFWQPEGQFSVIPLQNGAYLGSLLLSVSLLMASVMSILTPILIRHFGHSLMIGINYLMVCVFVCSHLYPSIYVLLPTYVIWGLSHSPAWISKTAILVHYGSKLSCSHYDCPLLITSNQPSKPQLNDTSMDEHHRLFCSRDQQIRRLVRWFHLAKDFGIIIGALITSVMLSTRSSSLPTKDLSATTTTTTITTTTTTTTNALNTSTSTASLAAAAASSSVNSDYLLTGGSWWYSVERSALIWSSSSTRGAARSSAPLLDDNDRNDYELDEHGVRICGADMCPSPIWSRFHVEDSIINDTKKEQQQQQQQQRYSISTSVSTRHGRNTLISFLKIDHSLIILIYLLFALTSLLLTLLSDKIQINYRRAPYHKTLRHNLYYVGPLAFFVGTEQAYILSDFLRAFVSCSLGINMVAGAIVGMGIMQAIVSCTLSMLLRHTKRIVVIVAAFFFHSCLLLALSTWKPTRDDSALFYVLAASWGACNGIWETVLMAFITVNHPGHVIEMTSPIQALRCLGLSVTFAAHSFLCETPKILTLVGILVVSVPPFALLEIRLEARRKAEINAL